MQVYAFEILRDRLDEYCCLKVIVFLFEKLCHSILACRLHCCDKELLTLVLATDKTKVIITKKGITDFDLFDYDKMLETK